MISAWFLRCVSCLMHTAVNGCVGDWQIVGISQIARADQEEECYLQQDVIWPERWEIWEGWWFGLMKSPPVLGDVERIVHKRVPMSVFLCFLLKPLSAFPFVYISLLMSAGCVHRHMKRSFSCCFNALQTKKPPFQSRSAKTNEKQQNYKFAI